MPSTSGLVSADIFTWRPKPTKSNTPLGIKVSQGLGVGVVTGASCATAKQARTNRIRTVVTAGCNERWIRLSIGRVVAFILRSFVILVTKRLSLFYRWERDQAPIVGLFFCLAVFCPLWVFCRMSFCFSR